MKLPDYRYECKNALDFCKDLPSESVNLIITSPPYNIGKSYETKTGIEDYLNHLYPIITELVRILANDGSLCWQIGNYVHNGEIYPLDI